MRAQKVTHTLSDVKLLRRFNPTERVKSSVWKKIQSYKIPMHFTRNNSQYIPDAKAKLYDL